jgi:hypothetical protein
MIILVCHILKPDPNMLVLRQEEVIKRVDVVLKSIRQKKIMDVYTRGGGFPLSSKKELGTPPTPPTLSSESLLSKKNHQNVRKGAKMAKMPQVGQKKCQK